MGGISGDRDERTHTCRRVYASNERRVVPIRRCSSHLGAMRRASSNFEIVRSCIATGAHGCFLERCVSSCSSILHYLLTILTEQQHAIVGTSHARLKITHDQWVP